MLVATADLLNKARLGHYSVGAFNVYNLEQVRAVIAAATTLQSPVILQMLPKALTVAGTELVPLCLAAGRIADVPVAVHLDHCSSEAIIEEALSAGVMSVMADGSHLPYKRNVAFIQAVMRMADRTGAAVEAELGRLTGSEDGITLSGDRSQLTDPDQATDFVAKTRVDALAVCIGNVHGTYHHPPEMDFERLAAIRQRVSVPLVLHGTSGLDNAIVQRCVEMGICKFNVNTELRKSYIASLRSVIMCKDGPELIEVMQHTIEAMQLPVQAKIELFCSMGKA